MKKHLVYSMKNQIFASPLNEVIELISLKELYRTKEDGISVVFWEGSSIPVLEPMVLRNLPPSKISTHTRIAVMKKSDYIFGILVDKTLGVIQMKMDEVEEENINDMGYSEGVYQKNIKILRTDSYLTRQKIELYEKIYQLTENDMQDVYQMNGIQSIGQEKIIQEVTTHSLNWIIYANQKNIEEDLMVGMLEIHDLIKRL